MPFRYFVIFEYLLFYKTTAIVIHVVSIIRIERTTDVLSDLRLGIERVVATSAEYVPIRRIESVFCPYFCRRGGDSFCYIRVQYRASVSERDIRYGSESPCPQPALFLSSGCRIYFQQALLYAIVAFRKADFRNAQPSPECSVERVDREYGFLG